MFIVKLILLFQVSKDTSKEVLEPATKEPVVTEEPTVTSTEQAIPVTPETELPLKAEIPLLLKYLEESIVAAVETRIMNYFLESGNIATVLDIQTLELKGKIYYLFFKINH